jgi:hypothetical protein
VLVLISSGLPADDGSPAIDQAAATAAAARATVHVLFRRVAGWRRQSSGSDIQTGLEARRPDVPAATMRRVSSDEEGLTSLAVMTGGTLLEVGRNVDQVIERLAAGLGGAYAVTIDIAEADRDARAHDLRVAVRRTGLGVVRARRRWMLRDEPAPAALETPAASVPMEAPRAPLRPEPVPFTSRPAPAARDDLPDTPDPALGVLLASVSEYLSVYERDLSAIVAEERYRARTCLRPAASGSIR